MINRLGRKGCGEMGRSPIPVNSRGVGFSKEEGRHLLEKGKLLGLGGERGSAPPTISGVQFDRCF